MAEPIPKAPPFDAATFQKALDENIRRPDGKPYAVFKQFRDWKLWDDKQRDYVETHRIQLGDHKVDIDEHSARLMDLEARMAAVEAQPVTRFP